MDAAATPASIHEVASAVLNRARGLTAALDGEEANARVLVFEITACARSALSVLDLALDHYEEGVTASIRGIRFELVEGGLGGELDRRISRPDGVAKISGVAFVARLGLRRYLQSLDRPQGDAPDHELVELCGGAIRETIKAMRAVDQAICHVEGITRDDAHDAAELALALQIRHAYCTLARDLDGGAPATRDTIRRRVRLSAAAIARLLGRDVAAAMRARDRASLRSIQDRIRAFLRADPASLDGSSAAGARILADLAGCTAVLLRVNHREEILEHDRRILAEAQAHCEREGDRAGTLALVRAAAGRDPEIDALLDAPSGALDEDLCQAIRRVRARLGECG